MEAIKSAKDTLLTTKFWLDWTICLIRLWIIMEELKREILTQVLS